MTPEWRRLIEAPAHEIHLMARDTNLPPAVYWYARVVSLFLQGDVERLRDLRLPPEHHDRVGELAKLRLGIRERRLNRAELIAYQEKSFGDVLDGEKWFCLGMAWELADADERA